MIGPTDLQSHRIVTPVVAALPSSNGPASDPVATAKKGDGGRQVAWRSPTFRRQRGDAPQFPPVGTITQAFGKKFPGCAVDAVARYLQYSTLATRIVVIAYLLLLAPKGAFLAWLRGGIWASHYRRCWSPRRPKHRRPPRPPPHPLRPPGRTACNGGKGGAPVAMRVATRGTMAHQHQPLPEQRPRRNRLAYGSPYAGFF